MTFKQFREVPNPCLQLQAAFGTQYLTVSLEKFEKAATTAMLGAGKIH